MQAVILSVGDELVLGQTVDTNSAYLAAKLASIGVSCAYHQTVADDTAAIVRAIDLACRSAPLVLITGGLGPTEDDLTRDALAAAMGVDLVEDAAQVERLQAFFALRGRPMPQRNRVQALHPRGSHTVPNDNGTAPGLKAALHGATLYIMPGVPREMRLMYEHTVEPEILRMPQTCETCILAMKINTFGWGESAVAQALGPDLMDRGRNPKVGTTVADGFVSVRLRSEFPTREEAQARLRETATIVQDRLGAIVFGTEDQTLQESVIALLREHPARIVTAESCTGGLLGKMLTDVPGSSAVYVGGWVAYSDDIKSDQLQVPAVTLAAHGAVSQETARAMAEGALRRAPLADYSLAITGVAGPDGGTPQKPVGTVWIALGIRRAGGAEVMALLCRLPGDRESVRDRAAKSALQALRLYLLNQPMSLLQWWAPASTSA